MKKFNAVLALLTSALVIIHIGTMGLLLVGAVAFSPVYHTVGTVLLVVLGLHVVISLAALAFFQERGGLFRYPRFNMGTIIQRASALLMIICVCVHYYHYTAILVNGVVQMTAQAAAVLVFDLLLTAVAVTHTCISFPKALITLSLVKTDAALRRAKLLSVIASAALGIAAAFALIDYYRSFL